MWCVLGVVRVFTGDDGRAVVLLASATVILFFLFCMMFFVSVDTITLQL